MWQSASMVLWAYATLRHEHAKLFEGLAVRSLELIKLTAEEGGFHIIQMRLCVWVSMPAVPLCCIREALPSFPVLC